MAGSVTIDMSGLDAKFARLRSNEIPSAMRNTINDLMQDVVKRERQEIKTVFDRPTPYIANSPAIKTKATKTSWQGEVWLRGEKNVLKPHIPGYEPRRDLKGIEDLLRGMGQLGNNQYLMPSRTMRLDSFGNVSRRTVAIMMQSLKGKGKGAYIWGVVQGKRGPVAGVWITAAWKARRPGALALVAVDATPTYGKVFDFYGVAKQWSKQRIDYHARRAIETQIARRNR